ncbi:hypothetical protein CMQ_3377 [Grosmannia clavigera kw1407]|uniref:Uncharacterized protein n=1 Tax=Grosmannia clavigera (strain kw1407 / UAMH 11150) TaxID=655863 RepID=F0X8A2_GROCL|nr:uncharacterized protein CMQ_3377 [Grosmannia clavigera kw1407]EFX05308.1 hypothetical protein CMQ_3377 [Grosmannia clavigera kw1407]
MDTSDVTFNNEHDSGESGDSGESDDSVGSDDSRESDDSGESDEMDESDMLYHEQPLKCDTLWNPASRRDLTIHMELEVESDIKGSLQKAAYLRRLGHFQQADCYFRENLADFFDTPLVVLEYADLLLAQGDYRRVLETFAVDEFVPDSEASIMSALSLQLSRCNRTLRMFSGIYKTLLRESRYWELRDIFHALLEVSEIEQTCRALMDTKTAMAGVSKLVADWQATAPDQAAQLCLLQVLVSFSRPCVQKHANDSSLASLTGFIFDQAREIASATRDRRTENTNCRAYLDWILTEEEYA